MEKADVKTSDPQAVSVTRLTTDDPQVGTQVSSLPVPLQKAVDGILDDWTSAGKVARLWARDASLWTDADEARWLDWLTVVDDQLEQIDDLQRELQFVRGEGFRHAVLLGMGGSSLAPDVLRHTFGVAEGFPDWQVLDSTDPAQIRAVEQHIDYASTLFLVSSKSGGTLEPNILKDYFFTRAGEAVEGRHPGNQFMAVTDPGSSLEKTAEADYFRKIFHGNPEIGGRFSALSNFGVVPALAMGIDAERLLDSARHMVRACSAGVPAAANPGVVLGAILGAAAGQGRDKVTLVVSPGIGTLGAWLEQLLAESTGKQGKGLIPVDGERLAAPRAYGDDRLFVYLRLSSDADAQQDEAVAQLEAAGQPVVRIEVNGLYDLGQEFFRWEMATAVAGAVMGINAFDQPDVEASKIVTRELTAEYEASGVLPAGTPLAEDDLLALYTDEKNAAALRQAAGDDTVVGFLRAHLARLGAGDYFALLAYLNRLAPAHEDSLQAIRHRVRDHCRVATCLGYGPRFLHSTGQAYKGGPGSGVFLQLTCDDGEDLPVPGHAYSFGVVKAAQALGDFEVLAERGRRALRVHLAADTHAALQALENLVVQALAS